MKLKGKTMIKVTSILMLVFGGISVISGIINLFILVWSGLLALLTAGAMIAAGIIGLRGCGRKEQASLCIIMGCVVLGTCLLCGIISIVLSNNVLMYAISKAWRGILIAFEVFGLILNLVVPGLYTLGAVMNRQSAPNMNIFQEVRAAGREVFHGATQAVSQNVQKAESRPSAKAEGTWVCSCGYAGNRSNFCLHCGKARPVPAAAPADAPKKAAETWTCGCGYSENRGNFCLRCGKARPVVSEERTVEEGWSCACGAAGNQGNFCPKCGARKPENVQKAEVPEKPTCPKCGWQPEAANGPVHFCLRCGASINSKEG